MDIEDLVGGDDIEMKVAEAASFSTSSIQRKRGKVAFVKPPPRAPKLEILELKDEYIKFVLSDTDASMANSFRRVMIAEVPTIAIDKVLIEENTTVLSDEFLAHRLGLVPIQSSSVGQYNYTRECDCQLGCERCEVNFSLNVRNDEIEGNMEVFASSINCESESSVCHPVGQGQGVLLVKLGQNQELRLTAKAYKGIGKEHAKWGPCAVATYQFDPEVKIDRMMMERMSEKQKRDLADVCPTKVFGYKEESKLVVVEAMEKCTYCRECKWKATSMGLQGLVSVEPKPGRFVFTVEAVGQLRPEEIVFSAFQQLRKKLEHLETELQVIAQQQAGGAEKYAF